MRVLSIHTMGHDTGLALFENGELIFSIETERLTRKKHDHRIEIALDYYLKKGPENPKDVDLIVFSTNIKNKFAKIKDFDRVVETINRGELHYETHSYLFDKKNDCLVVAHEASHAALACHYANWKDPSIILVNEGRGTFSRNAVFIYKHGKLSLYDFNMLPWYATGFAWSAISYSLGYGISPSTAGKVMAMGGYGSESNIMKRAFYEIDNNIHFRNREDQQKSLKSLMSKTNFLKNWQSSADCVCTLQQIFIEGVFYFLKKLQKELEIDQIALGGGCALNLPLNTFIRNHLCSDVAISPACNDSGQAIGAGVYALKLYGNKKVIPFSPWKNGTIEADSEIKANLKKTNLIVKQVDIKLLANKLESGHILSFYDQISAIGPRSLGNRSILANPAIPGMRSKVSEKLKQREWFRPLAPIMRLESFNRLFPGMSISPYMLFNYNAKNKGFPEAVHVDGTSRIQTLGTDANPRLRLLLEEFENLTGIPALINTSLNNKECSIAYRSSDVINDFINSSIDVFVFGNMMALRN